jgi:outer membrane receptor protein involved in Fe transport
MNRYRKWYSRLSLVAVGTAAWAVGFGRAADTTTPVTPGTPVRLQQPAPTAPMPGNQPAPTAPTPGNQPAPTAPTPESTAAGATGFNPLAALGVGNAAPPSAGNTVNPVSSVVPLAGANAAPTLNAPDLGELLSKSPAAAGVDVQRRNAVSSDPRIRGYRVGQYVALGDDAFFFPARQDLDTAVAKFDPGTVRDIVIVKGPYSALYGPGFSFLDIVTLDAPRYDCFQVHGRSSFGYQTNGQQWDGLQSVFTGDKEWGFRATYNLLAGNDYQDGSGQLIAASYNSDNINYAFGLNLTENSKLEFKGLRVHQQNVEFPGLYFDIRNLDTEGYNVRYTLDNQPYFDRFTATAWYNTTVANGDTRQGAKQAFVQRLLDVSFNEPNLPYGVLVPPGPIPNAMFGPFQDFSTTHFSNKSLGYRAMMQWGEIDKPDKPLFTVGNDLSVIGQTLQENIRIIETGGVPIATVPPQPGLPVLLTQNQSIPRSTGTDPGLFAELFLPVNDRLKVKGGGRVDFVHTDSDQAARLITGNVNLFGGPGTPGVTVGPSAVTVDPIVYSSDPNNPATSRQFNLFSGFGSSEYVLDEHLTAIAAAGYAERAPTLTELYAAGPFIGVLQQGTSRLIGDPNLKKERLSQFDMGLKGDYDWVRGGVTGFYAVVDDYITFDANKTGPGITQVVFTNTNRATLAGGEMFTIVDVTSWLTPFANMSYVKGVDETHIDNRRSPNLASSRRNDPTTGEVAAATEPLPMIPPLEIRAGFRIHEPIAKPTDNPRWTIEFAARIDWGKNDVATSLGEYPTSGFTVFDIRSFWQVNDKLLLSAGVENFGDKLYRAHLDPISGNLLGVDPLFRPGTNFYFTTQLTY